MPAASRIPEPRDPRHRLSLEKRLLLPEDDGSSRSKGIPDRELIRHILASSKPSQRLESRGQEAAAPVTKQDDSSPRDAASASRRRQATQAEPFLLETLFESLKCKSIS